MIDSNMPTIGGPWWELMEKPPPDWQIWVQPGGLEPNAENLDHLPGGRTYYERLARGNNEAWITRYVHAQYGEDPAGTAVWQSFRRSFHVVESLEPVPGQLIIIGQDFGRNPCSLICQPDHKGRLMCLEEVVAEDIGLEYARQHFGGERARLKKFPHVRVTVVGDADHNLTPPHAQDFYFKEIRRMALTIGGERARVAAASMEAPVRPRECAGFQVS